MYRVQAYILKRNKREHHNLLILTEKPEILTEKYPGNSAFWVMVI